MNAQEVLTFGQEALHVATLVGAPLLLTNFLPHMMTPVTTALQTSLQLF